jgi:ABC-type oligopeptide transport system ATPase subunit
MALVSLQEVKIAFGGPQLLDGVTFHVERGERVCLVGRNGAGKSTIMKIVVGELNPDSGEVIRARGARIASLEQEVPQDLAGTVFDVVSEGLATSSVCSPNIAPVTASPSDDAALSRPRTGTASIESGAGQITACRDGILPRGWILLRRALRLQRRPLRGACEQPTSRFDELKPSRQNRSSGLRNFSFRRHFHNPRPEVSQTLATRIIGSTGAGHRLARDYQTYLVRRQAE